MPDDTAAIPKGEGLDGKVNSHAKMLSEHHDRLSNIEKRMGIEHKADDMKSEDQVRIGKDNPGRGHDTEKRKKADIYARRRHP